MARPHPAWRSLGWRARAWRIVHAVWSAAQLCGLAIIWRSVIARRRSRGLAAAVAFLLLEGAGLVVGRGNCPTSGLQTRWGDPVPFFELVLPPRAAKAAFPVLALVSLGGLLGLALRPPIPGAGIRRRT